MLERLHAWWLRRRGPAPSKLDWQCWGYGLVRRCGEDDAQLRTRLCRYLGLL